MKPLRLELTAFGPFAARQVIDFAELRGRSFFLIHGATGAGKTSLLDGICFALYGQTSGSARTAKQMRSDHASPATLTRVVFDFALRGESYRVIRIPEQDRPRKRGAGTTTQEQEAEFYKRTAAVSPDDNGVAQDSSWSGVNSRVEELMGFKCEQFRQVVLLPQGQFQKLLMDGSAARQQILETLFRVELYSKIENALKASAADISRRNTTLRDRRDENFRQAEAVTLEALESRQAGLTRELAAAGEGLSRLRQAKQASQQAVEAGRAVAAKLAERETATREVRTLEARKEQIAVRQTEHARAVKAAGLTDLEAAVSQRTREQQEAAARRVAVDAALADAVARQTAAEKALRTEQAREPLRAQARERVTGLRAMNEKVAELAQARLQFNAATDTARIRTETRVVADRELARVQAQAGDAEKALAEAAALAGKAAENRSELKDAEALVKNLTELDALAKRLTAAEAAHTEATNRVANGEKYLEEARTKQRALNSSMREAMAATLAQELGAGAACPVCGSTHHPNLARAEHALPRQEELDAARQTVEKSEEKIGRLRAEAARADVERQTCQNSIAHVKSMLGADASARGEEVRVQVEGLRQEVARAEAALREMGSKQATVDRLQSAVKGLEKRLAEATEAAVEAGGQRQVTETILKKAEAAVPANLRLPGSLARESEAANQALQAFVDAMEKATQAVQTAAIDCGAGAARQVTVSELAASAAAALAAQRKAFEQRLVGEGFDGEADYRSAKRSAAEVARFDKEITDYHLAVGTAREQLRQATAAAQRMVAPDVIALEAADSEAAKALESGTAAHTDLQARLRRHDDWLATIRQIDGELAGLDARYRVVGRIADAANGNNRYRISFQRYVLGVFLDEVLGQANLRLHIMSYGRFRLQRATDPADTRRHAGLDLEVYDEHTSTLRPVATLSGGESFLASLSLALGLADVVQEKAGGVHLETIFIDEGFGTLDPETLDLAIRALRDLQKGGRLVGIISHVTELKEWIDARLEVTKGRAGSSAKFVLA